MGDLDELLRDQAAYYRAVAGEYDRAYESEDLRSLNELAEGLPIHGDVLELACGTGQWTRMLAARGHRVTAVDAAPEMLAIARERVAGLDVEFVQADLFTWRPPRQFDTVFFAFWLSHVPPAQLAAFWRLVEGALRPGGRACFVDDGPGQQAAEEVLAGQAAPAVRRRLEDGSAHRIVKTFADPDRLTQTLEGLGWSARVRPVRTKLVVGSAAVI
ncbi:methyltransferase domain-containing protein [Micromonospora sp. NPDC049301]|uniref:class I SAM-dependent methyltransferase n=1 Tax=Micromonospora sp. NPDC049301 TaxID=3155723 RepID=UPI003412386C